MGETHVVLDFLLNGMPRVLRAFLGSDSARNSWSHVPPGLRRRIPGANGPLLDLLAEKPVIRVDSAGTRQADPCCFRFLFLELADERRIRPLLLIP